MKIVIPKERRVPMLMQLNFIGVNRKSLFPDLDGLCEYLRWRVDPELLNHGLVTNNAEWGEEKAPLDTPPFSV